MAFASGLCPMGYLSKYSKGQRQNLEALLSKKNASWQLFGRMGSCVIFGRREKPPKDSMVLVSACVTSVGPGNSRPLLSVRLFTCGNLTLGINMVLKTIWPEYPVWHSAPTELFWHPEVSTRQSGFRDSQTGVCNQTLQGHSQPVRTVTFSPDGSMLASGSDDKTVKFWETPKGNLLKTHDPEIGKISAVTFGSDSKTFVTAGEAADIKVWDVRRLDQQKSRPTAKPVPQSKQQTEQKSVKLEFQQALEGHNGEIVCIDLSSDGSVLASTGTDGTVRVWDLARNSCIHIEDINAKSEAVDINQDGTLLAAGNKEGHLFVWRLPSLEEVISTSIGQSEILTVRFSDQTPFVACLMRDGRVMYHRLDGSETFTRWKNPTGYFAVAYALSREGAYLAWGGMGVLSVRKNRGDGPEVEYNFRKDLYSPSRLQFCPVDESRLLGVGFSSNDIHLWDVVKGKQVRRYVGHTKPPFSISFSPDGKIIASVGRDGTLRLWDYHSADNLVTLKPDYGKTVWAVMFHPEGHTLFTGGADGTIKVWKLVSQQSTPKQQSKVDKPVGPTPENIIRVEPVPVERPPAEKTN